VSVVAAIVYVAALLVVAFIVSGVVPRLRAARARTARVAVFAQKYGEWAKAEDSIPGEEAWRLSRCS
jgi:uncharacterized membrane protein